VLRDRLILKTKGIYKEMSQGNSLCSCLKQAKMSFFFSPTKSREQEGRTGLPCGSWGDWVGTGGREEVAGKGCGRVNRV
jgi:hypothetical protein